MVTPFHSDTFKYTAAQEEIMTVLSGNLEPGAYSMPGTNPSVEMTHKEMEKEQSKHVGKPWALVFYNKSFEGLTPGYMITGFLLNLLGAVVAVSLLNISNASARTSGTRFMMVLLLPLFAIVQAVLVNWNWWSFPWHFIKGEVFDLLIGWGLAGLFLSWHYGRKTTTA
jgi:hypothetical protein